MSTASSAGTVLGGRYRLEDLLDDVTGARSWRATDTVLVRDVRVCALPDDDPRVEAVMEAARLSARVTDAHLLRVLDADVRDGLAWVVSEWGEGRTLAEMVGRGVLPADRSAWLVREVATAVASAAQHGLAHGRLAPENVMVTASGTVRLIGFAVDAAVQQDLARSGLYPDATGAEADRLDLAALLYAALVGKWAGASGSVVEEAPRDARGPLRPRQVRAGVPRALDAMCDRVLTRQREDLDAHRMATVLTEYLGELAAADPSLLPVPAPEVGRVPAPVAPPSDTTPPTNAATDPAADPPATPSVARPVAAAGPTDVPATDPGTGSHRADVTVVEGGSSGDPDTQRAADPEPAADPEATRAGKHRPTGPDDDPDWYKPRTGPRPPVPELDPPPERPLFAPDDGGRRVPEPAGRTAAQTSVTESWGATDWATLHPRQEWSAERRDDEPRWPVGQDPQESLEPPEDPPQHWLRLPIFLGLLAALAVLVAFVLAFRGG